MIAITIEDISLSFGVKSILENVTFSLDEADRLGIIGVNGCGKSTLFKIICGELAADGGAVYVSKDKTVGILRQDDAFRDFSDDDKKGSALEAMLHAFPELLSMEKKLAELEIRLRENENDVNSAHEYTALNEKFIASGGLEFRGRCASTLQKLGFDKEMQDRCVNDFSGGQRTRLALARELCREPDILMLDEPTNHLDTETLTWLENYLLGYKKCLMVISHDRYFLDRVTNKTLCIENRRAKLYQGGYTKSMEQRKTDLEIEWRHYKNQQKEIARQEAYIAQQRAWNRERNIIAAESRLKLLEKMEKIERPEDAPKGIRMRFSEAIASGNDVMRLNGLGFAYPDGPKIIDCMSFTVKRGDRLFLVGPNGCGKSTLIKLLMGTLFPSAGYIEHGYNVKMGYYDQENQHLTPGNTVLDELWNDYRTLDEAEVRGTLALFRFVGDDVFKHVSELSGGERARLTLAKLMLKDTNLLVLDEPTNHLDINSREVLEGALEEYGGTVVIVSHDRYLIQKLATRLVDMTPSCGALFTDMTVMNVGEGYAELMRDRERRENLASVSAAAAPTMSSAKESYLKNKKENADRRNAQKRLERLKKEAEAIEKEIDEIDALMCGEAATDYTRLSELDERKNILEERLLEIYGEI